MSLNIANKKAPRGKKAPAVDAGSYPARLVQIVDLGIQPQRAYKGEAKDPVHQARFTYELNDEFMKDEEGNELVDKPRWVSEEIPLYALSSDRATSSKRYKALDPNEDFGGDFEQCIGNPVSLVLTKGGKEGEENNYIAGTNSVRPKDADKMEPLKNDALIFSLDSDDVKTFKSLPEWLQNKIKDGPEFSSYAFAKALNSNIKEEPETDEDGQEDSTSKEDW